MKKQKIKKIISRLWEDESGQGTLEYALIVVAVVAVVAVFGDKMKTTLGNYIKDYLPDVMEGLKVPQTP